MTKSKNITFFALLNIAIVVILTAFLVSCVPVKNETFRLQVADRFNTQSLIAASQNKPGQSEVLRAAAVWEVCNVDDNTHDMCLRLGIIELTGDNETMHGVVRPATMPALAPISTINNKLPDFQPNGLIVTKTE